MAAARALFRRAAGVSDSPSEVLTRVNEALMKDLPAGRFVTMAYLVLDPSQGLVRCANAGHPAFLLMPDHGEPVSLETTHGFPLGLMPSRYSEVAAKLECGSSILIYSDGVLEATDGGGQEYGGGRLVEFAHGRDVSASSLLADVRRFTAGGALSDDATAVVVRRL
jgi:sigma-B regulation protein RsbU (phosphoserine phosphatase)